MKNTFIKSLIDKQEIHSKLVFISVDQETGFDEELKQLLGDRFIMESISEQYVLGFASGLAADGFLPIVFNHAAFTIRRSYEQILLDCCLQERKVILLGMGGGFATSHLGPSHTTFDDIALTRVMPNMEIFIPCGSNDIVTNFNHLINTKNSVYVRLSKYGKYNLEGYNEYINTKLLYKNYGTNENLFCIISTGPISYNVFEAAEDLGINLLHIHIPFLKNIDKDAISYLCKNCVKILIFEEHSKIGGLFSAISEILLMSSHLKGIKVNNFGIDDQFVHKYGTQENIWASFNLDKKSIKEILITHKQ
jgi:transketolase